MGVIYQAKNKANGKRYVGKTVRTMNDRRYTHESHAKKGGGFLLHKALRKYGLDSFDWLVLFSSDDPKELDRMECRFVRCLKTKAPNGYNLTDGGEGSKLSEETKAKMGKSREGHTCLPETRAKIGKAHKGMRHSPESIEKMKGKVKLPETIAKMKKSLTGRTLSEEHKANLREVNTGRVMPLKTRAKIRKSMTGRIRSEEHKANLRKASTGKVIPLETRAKLRKTMIRICRTEENRIRARKVAARIPRDEHGQFLPKVGGTGGLIRGD